MRLIILTLFLSALVCRAQPTLGINLSKTNAVVTVSNTAVGTAYLLQSSADLLTWQEAGWFKGSNNPVRISVRTTNAVSFFRAASQPIFIQSMGIYHNFVPSRVVPGTWEAYPTLNWSEAIGGWGSVLSINGVRWMVFVHSENLVELRTVNACGNSPTFNVGDQVILVN